MWRHFYIVFIYKLSLYFFVTSERTTWSDFMKNAKWVTNRVSQKFEPYILQHYPFGNVSELCTDSLRMYANGLIEWEPWAVKMFDATGKFPRGFISGTNLELGSFDDCLSVKAESKHASELFKGKYCIVIFKTPLIYPLTRNTSSGKSYVVAYGHPPAWIANTMKTQEGILSNFGLYLGTCMPSTCSEQDLYNVISAFAKPAELKVSLSDCQVDETRKWPVTAKIAISLILLLIGICIFGTTLDMRDRKKEEEKQKFNESFSRKLVKAFSLYKNSEKLFEKKKSSSSLDSLYGIRFWICLWIVFGHCFLFPTLWKEMKYTNFHHTLQMLSKVAIAGENAIINVENFYVLSGFLMTYTLWRKLERSRGNINITETIVQKYWRLTPAHIFTIVLAFAMPVLYRGPIWNSTWKAETEKCINYGWMNLFYIQNFLPIDNMCWLHTWYIGALMQIQVVSLLLIVFTYRYPKTGISIGLLMIAGCIIHDYSMVIKNGLLLPSLHSIKDFDLIRLYASKVYLRTFNHFAAHAIGMLLGWYVLNYKDRKLHIAYHVAGWILSAVLSVGLMFAVRHPTKDIRLAAVHNSVRNILWSLTFSWLVYTCTTGSARILEKFFSMSFLLPFSQVSYFVYLLHPLLIVFSDAALKQRMYMGKIPHMVQFMALTMAIFPLAFIAYIMVEAPFNSIYDLWTENKSPLKRSQMSNRSSVTNEMKFIRNVKAKEKDL